MTVGKMIKGSSFPPKKAVADKPNAVQQLKALLTFPKIAPDHFIDWPIFVINHKP